MFMTFQSNRRFLTFCRLSFKQRDWWDSKQGVIVGESSCFVVYPNKMSGKFDKEEDFTVFGCLCPVSNVALQLPPCFMQSGDLGYSPLS